MKSVNLQTKGLSAVLSLNSQQTYRKNLDRSIETNRRNPRIVENFLVIWLDINIDESNADFKHSIDHLRQLVNSIETFIDVDECLDFLHHIKDEKVFLILSGSLGQQLVRTIHRLNQLELIYIFCSYKAKHEQWANPYEKIQGVCIDIQSICHLLKEDIRRSQMNLTSVTMLPAKGNHVDVAFMYFQLLKEILIDIENEDNEISKLVQFCREQYAGNDSELKFIHEFETTYSQQSLL